MTQSVEKMSIINFTIYFYRFCLQKSNAMKYKWNATHQNDKMKEMNIVVCIRFYQDLC